jgi:acyl-CoA dehydrogenase
LQFGTQLKKVIGHGLENFALSIGRGVKSTAQVKTRSKGAYLDGDALLKHHEDQLLRLSANFALTADLCFTLGGKLKFEELLMGRLSDAMGAIFLGYSTLHYYHNNRGMEGLEAVTEHAMLRLEYEAQQALSEAKDNFPGPLGGVASAVMGVACYPLGGLTRPYKKPDDALTKRVAELVTKPSGFRDMLTEHVYMAPEGESHQVSELIRALPLVCKADEISAQLRKEKRGATVDEQAILDEAEAVRDHLIQVDVFDHATEEEKREGYVRPAIQGTNEMLGDVKEFKEFAIA